MENLLFNNIDQGLTLFRKPGGPDRGCRRFAAAAGCGAVTMAVIMDTVPPAGSSSAARAAPPQPCQGPEPEP